MVGLAIAGEIKRAEQGFIEPIYDEEENKSHPPPGSDQRQPKPISFRNFVKRELNVQAGEPFT